MAVEIKVGVAQGVGIMSLAVPFLYAFGIGVGAVIFCWEVITLKSAEKRIRAIARYSDWDSTTRSLSTTCAIENSRSAILSFKCATFSSNEVRSRVHRSSPVVVSVRKSPPS
jgi:hypothetical protein